MRVLFLTMTGAGKMGDYVCYMYSPWGFLPSSVMISIIHSSSYFLCAFSQGIYGIWGPQCPRSSENTPWRGTLLRENKPKALGCCEEQTLHADLLLLEQWWWTHGVCASAVSTEGSERFASLFWDMWWESLQGPLWLSPGRTRGVHYGLVLAASSVPGWER